MKGPPNAMDRVWEPKDVGPEQEGLPNAERRVGDPEEVLRLVQAGRAAALRTGGGRQGGLRPAGGDPKRDRSRLGRGPQRGSMRWGAPTLLLHQRQTVGLALGILGNRDDAAEVAQEAFLKAHVSLARLSEPARLGSLPVLVAEDRGE